MENRVSFNHIKEMVGGNRPLVSLKNFKKFLIVVLMATLSFSLMACPEIINLQPEIVLIQDEEIIQVNEIIYEHEQGTEFTVNGMLQDLIDNQGLAGIDYDQNGVAVGSDRKYSLITDRIIIETFYAVWSDGDDANGDNVVNDDDIPF